ncbi:MAG: hypothetical protein NXH73_00565 [Flavobacteriaceae bacterium]|nr:hypothetical protein [Flavobacteriaceae bacterium]
MKKVVYIVLTILFSTALFSCGVTKEYSLNETKEVTFTLKEKKEIVKQQIVKKQRTIIAAP